MEFFVTMAELAKINKLFFTVIQMANIKNTNIANSWCSTKNQLKLRITISATLSQNKNLQNWWQLFVKLLTHAELQQPDKENPNITYETQCINDKEGNEECLDENKHGSTQSTDNYVVDETLCTNDKKDYEECLDDNNYDSTKSTEEYKIDEMPCLGDAEKSSIDTSSVDNFLRIMKKTHDSLVGAIENT